MSLKEVVLPCLQVLSIDGFKELTLQKMQVMLPKKLLARRRLQLQLLQQIVAIARR
jgi:hypothetical protein